MNLLLRSNGLFSSRATRALLFSTGTLGSSFASSAELNRRIMSVGDRKVSMLPVLDKWVGEGRSLPRNDLQKFIRKLRKYNRFDHALQMSQWMSDSMKGNAVSPSDIAVHLDLISKVYGLEEAEKYFNSLRDDFKGVEVHGALLHCYAEYKCLEKAEATMENMKVKGFLVNTLSYNVMLTLYSNLGEYQKIGTLIRDMEKRGFSGNRVTYKILLKTSVAASNIEEMEKLLAMMEADFQANVDWYTYVIAARGYLKAGLVEKALEMLKKSEKLIERKSARFAYVRLLSLYGDVGKRDEVYRIWNLYKDTSMFFSLAYFSMISSLIKLDDIDGAERIWEEWIFKKKLVDTRIPNMMIIGYSKKGRWENAEAVVKLIIERGLELDANAWGHLATGYHIGGQMAKAVETMKKAFSICKPNWKPNVYTLAACHQYLEGQGGDGEAAEGLLKMVKEHCDFAEAICDRLQNCVTEGNLSSRAIDQLGDDAKVLEGVPASLQLNDESSTEL